MIHDGRRRRHEREDARLVLERLGIADVELDQAPDTARGDALELDERLAAREPIGRVVGRHVPAAQEAWVLKGDVDLRDQRRGVCERTRSIGSSGGSCCEASAAIVAQSRPPEKRIATWAAVAEAPEGRGTLQTRRATASLSIAVGQRASAEVVRTFKAAKSIVECHCWVVADQWRWRLRGSAAA